MWRLRKLPSWSRTLSRMRKTHIVKNNCDMFTLSTRHLFLKQTWHVQLYSSFRSIFFYNKTYIWVCLSVCLSRFQIPVLHLSFWLNMLMEERHAKNVEVAFQVKDFLMSVEAKYSQMQWWLVYHVKQASPSPLNTICLAVLFVVLLAQRIRWCSRTAHPQWMWDATKSATARTGKILHTYIHVYHKIYVSKGNFFSFGASVECNSEKEISCT